MKRFLTTVTVTALSALLTVTSFDSAAAAPIQPLIQPAIQQTENQPAGLVEVQYRHHNRNFRRHHRPHYRPHYRNHHRGGYWHGHRGYRYHRPGYRRHDGWWYPMAAFTAGAIIGGAVSQPPRGSAHVRWCASRYKTYRASDNTYQPTNGPRRQCVVR